MSAASPFRRFSTRQGPGFALSKVRLTCGEADRGSLHVKSTCGPTVKLETKTDEDIAFSDQDLVIIKNCRESPCTLKFRALELPEGRQAIFRPSRQATQKIYDSRVSEVRSEYTVTLGGWEALVIVTSEWVAGRGQGAGAVMVV
jgi:hypothetical protein